ncbi:hypothetical protein Corgl_0782 [Coriobacterium glomerans PW2]|uniref:Uncharacterized protein n=2 Tax=Coriobacterium TaxID=33870 RepID=F2NBT6_CORGP|nr:hypothetical protein Corgl_0782 [Coriobacterium glomerans PW2]
MPQHYSRKTAPKKKLGKKEILAIILVILIISGIGNAMSKSKQPETPKKESQEQKTSKKKSDKKKNAKEDLLDGLVDKPLDEAIASINDAGLKVTYNNGTKSNGALFESDDPYSFTLKENAKNMVVTKVEKDSAGGHDAKITIQDKAGIEREKQAKATRDALEKKLDKTDAWIAVKTYGEKQYPYGFKVHYMLNELSAEPLDENTWGLKSTCDITNGYGAETKGKTIEAKVTGTSDAPQVIEFNVY